MKTAVSIPDPVFKAADKLAQRLGMSRSSLYAEALHRYLQLHDEHAITSKLNEVLAHDPSELHPSLQSIQARSIPRESWK
jgi:metal-responsive CopG/Arc/MetJ family transcriptional regulator